MRTRTCIDAGWRFNAGDTPAANAAAFDDGGWRTLDLPHDWSIEGTPHPDNPAGAAGGFFPGGVGWYRKRLDIPADLADRHVIIEFDGVYTNSEVWCNGHSCGRRPYGYISFAYDLTPHVRAGEPACIAVRVDNSRQKNCRWYSGSGIYRHVWLTLAGPVRVAHWGTFVTTPEAGAERAVVACAVTVVTSERGTRNAERGIDVQARVLDETESRPIALSIPDSAFRVPRSAFDLRLELPNPRLWSPDTPHLYTLRIELKQDGRLVDTCDTRFGIRTIRFDPHEGFFLNGQRLKFRGVNEHHDAGCLGAAVPDDVTRRRLRILKEMGCNAIRVAHNPASPAFLDLCDETGFLVVEDAFDEWKDGKTPFGYGQYWNEWWERDLTDMIRRDRNHPCVVLWSVGNEIKEVREGRPEGLAVMRALRGVCHREDPTRPMTCGCCNSRQTLAAGYGPLMDVFGYNGGGGGCFDYEQDHAAFPAMPMFASEHPHTLQTRGVYRTRTWYRDLARNPDNVRWHEPSAECGMRNAECGTGQMQSATPRSAFRAPRSDARPPLELMRIPDLAAGEIFTRFDEHYQSSYGNAVVRMSIFDSWRRTRRLPYFCGEFRWTGFDYLGECYGWPCKSWNFGVIDLCGFPKDAYYFYQSQWTDVPMVHLLPHWTWPGLEGRFIPVIAYSNCDRVELFLDGILQGAKEMPNAECRMSNGSNTECGMRNAEYDGAMWWRWDVPYRPGALRAVAYRGAKAVAACVHETAGEPAAIRLHCEEGLVRADSTGIAHVVASVVDAEGRPVPHASPDIAFAVEGPARLIGLENGDPLDTTNYKLDHRRAFHGMMLAVVQADAAAGTVTVRACAPRLVGGTCSFRTERPAE